MTVAQITRLLARRHALDVFVDECKTGATWRGRHRRLDAWACRASWASPSMVGYEIKLSRADWRGDRKWREYLGVCNRFYFVVPAGLIQPEEIEAPAGLIWASADKLSTRRVAAHRREVQLPADLLFYVLICRARVLDRPWYGGLADRPPTVGEWRAWATARTDSRAVGALVRTRVGRMEKRLARVEARLAEARVRARRAPAIEREPTPAQLRCEQIGQGRATR